MPFWSSVYLVIQLDVINTLYECPEQLETQCLVFWTERVERERERGGGERGEEVFV